MIIDLRKLATECPEHGGQCKRHSEKKRTFIDANGKPVTVLYNRFKCPNQDDPRFVEHYFTDPEARQLSPRSIKYGESLQEEIVSLREQGTSYEDIYHIFRKRGIEVPPSTVFDIVKRRASCV